ncbi:hypothetical protein EKO27_g4042 [Xylaria grammica]|uniref:Uncharacterized protein n=1 Tax=Xylaria grammica TaxID=363999 RepID=A0A439D9F7_9PEZI|nr:hypothetical protein EKO27_g4042 [Xylaria grammica]
MSPFSREKTGELILPILTGHFKMSKLCAEVLGTHCTLAGVDDTGSVKNGYILPKGPIGHLPVAEIGRYYHEGYGAIYMDTDWELSLDATGSHDLTWILLGYHRANSTSIALVLAPSKTVEHAYEPQLGDFCPDSQSTTLIKCVFWGSPTSVDNAKNTGFRYYDFDIVIAGSNAYDSLAAPLEDGYAAPESLGTAQLNAPSDCGGFDTYLGSKMFTDGPFDPALCAAACTAQSEYNLAHPPTVGSAQTCQFFNTYLLLKNGLPEGQDLLSTSHLVQDTYLCYMLCQ